MDSLGASFVRQARRVLEHSPEVVHTWKMDDERSGTLIFPPSGDGFEVGVDFNDDTLIVFGANGAHRHFDDFVPGNPDSIDQQAAAALGFAGSLLSPDMRVRELRAGGKGYRWYLERKTADGWISEGFSSLLFFNYFGARSEHVFQNHQLPGTLP